MEPKTFGSTPPLVGTTINMGYVGTLQWTDEFPWIPKSLFRISQRIIVPGSAVSRMTSPPWMTCRCLHGFRAQCGIDVWQGNSQTDLWPRERREKAEEKVEEKVEEKGKERERGKRGPCRLRASPCHVPRFAQLFCPTLWRFDSPKSWSVCVAVFCYESGLRHLQEAMTNKTRRWDRKALSSLKVKDTKWSQPSRPFGHHQICPVCFCSPSWAEHVSLKNFFFAGCLLLR